MFKGRLMHGEEGTCACCGCPLYVGDLVYSLDEHLWGCSKTCAQSAADHAQRQYEERLIRGIGLHGVTRFCQMNPLLTEDIQRLARTQR